MLSLLSTWHEMNDYLLSHAPTSMTLFFAPGQEHGAMCLQIATTESLSWNKLFHSLVIPINCVAIAMKN